MKLENAYFVTQIFAGFAVVASLIFVGISVRQNTTTMETNSRQEAAFQDLAFFASALDTSVVARARSKLETGEQLSPLEHSQLVARQHMNFRVFENAYYQFQKGALETSEWQRYAQIINVLVCDYEPAQSMWLQNRKYFVTEFGEIVDQAGARCTN